MKIDNRTALEFNKQLLGLLNQICAPLKQFGITCFNYSRNFTDGKHLYLSNSQKWLELYISNNLQDDADHLRYYFPQPNIQHALWSGFQRDKAFDILYEHDMWNGFTIYEHYKDFTDIFDFGSTKENITIINFYLKNIKLLNRFVMEFKEKILSCIDFTDESKMIIPNIDLDVYQIERICFVSKDKIEKFFQQVDRVNNQVALSL